MTSTAIALPDCWGVDTNTKLTATSARALASASFQGHPLRFVWRYVFFGSPPRGDIDVGELDAILSANLVLLLVQHPRNPGWMASVERGHSDGQWAADNAANAGYLAGCALALDLEGLGNSGAPVIDHAEAWCEAVRGEGFWPTIYVGFDAGLTPEQLWDLRNVDRYWSDFGARDVAHRGFCCRQFAQTTIAGVQVDPDHHAPDRLGGTLSGMGRAADVTQPGITVETSDPESAA